MRKLFLAAAVLAHVVVLFACLSPRAALAADPPTPSWGRDGCHAGFKFCANVTTKETWSADGKNIYFFLDLVVDGTDVNMANTTVWYVGDNFDLGWATDLSKASFNVVRFSPRGSEFAYPQITCNPDYYSREAQCLPNASCAAEIARSGLDMAHYSTTETANDLVWVLKTLGKGRQNVLVSEGLGNLVVQRVMERGDGMKNVSVVMAGFTHPEYFDVFTSIGGYDGALQRLLAFCEEDGSMLCVSRVGAFEGMWNRVVNVMKAAKANTLPCNSRLDWGVAPKDMHREYITVLATLLKKPQNFLMPSEWRLPQLIPSFIYRLQRCTEGDQAALNNLYAFLHSGPRARCPPFVPQRYNWLVNELTLIRPPLPPGELFAETSKNRLVLPIPTLWQKMYEVYNAYPKYDATPAVVAAAKMPLLLLPSDIDPVFPFGMAALASTGYDATVRLLPHQSSFPVAASASDCVKQNLIYFRAHRAWADAGRCQVDGSYKLDFIHFDAYEFYRVGDAWEFTTPNTPEPTANASTTTTTAAPHAPGAKNCSNRAVSVLTVLFLLAVFGLAGLSYLYWRKTQSFRLSDDFYSNLNH
ncbi:uncharacterized protein Tco025E_00217 [Trypanosoma conorhini]|uniref:Peptidase S33 tripeptidyl aminopeptidase-like C-terminal domain-containing protein n=1 Tax=Trypanosoma conorhini TaxID=83891 RepID=A0A422QC77_9TRYP|nr:uncharacterized protein Tco025E_00217 [Trypanosoma conorhini]RNF27567.1 hypothetical protein Tco025E_00217 [Trypanosoma conorhini]